MLSFMEHDSLEFFLKMSVSKLTQFRLMIFFIAYVRSPEKLFQF